MTGLGFLSTTQTLWEFLSSPSFPHNSPRVAWPLTGGLIRCNPDEISRGIGIGKQSRKPGFDKPELPARFAGKAIVILTMNPDSAPQSPDIKIRVTGRLSLCKQFAGEHDVVQHYGNFLIIDIFFLPE